MPLEGMAQVERSGGQMQTSFLEGAPESGQRSRICSWGPGVNVGPGGRGAEGQKRERPDNGTGAKEAECKLRL